MRGHRQAPCPRALGGERRPRDAGRRSLGSFASRSGGEECVVIVDHLRPVVAGRTRAFWRTGGRGRGLPSPASHCSHPRLTLRVVFSTETGSAIVSFRCDVERSSVQALGHYDARTVYDREASEDGSQHQGECFRVPSSAASVFAVATGTFVPNGKVVSWSHRLRMHALPRRTLRGPI